MARKISIKISALQCKAVRFAKAYVNQYVALPKAMYSHSVYLYWISKREKRNIGKCTGGEKLGGGAETA